MRSPAPTSANSTSTVRVFVCFLIALSMIGYFVLHSSVANNQDRDDWIFFSPAVQHRLEGAKRGAFPSKMLGTEKEDETHSKRVSSIQNEEEAEYQANPSAVGGEKTAAGEAAVSEEAGPFETNTQQSDAFDPTSQSTSRNTNPSWTQPTPEDLAKLENCFPLNSKEWLKGPRHGNIRDPLMDDGFVAKMILFGQDTSKDPHTILQRSLCLKESRFLNVSDPLGDDRSIQLWIVRLTYLATHFVQHQFAIPEVQQRQSLSQECKELANKHEIGRFDYECPKGKFFVVPMENLGLGAVVRTNVLSGYLAALATNRTVLFVNHAPVEGPPPILTPWYHASCPRQDAQCFYQPTTPCVLTHDQLENAIVMNGFKNVTKLFRNPSRILEDDWFDAAREIILPLKTVTRRVPRTVPQMLRNFTLRFANDLGADDPRQEVLAKVADRFVSSVYRDKVDQLISYGIVFYAMRPHLKSQKELAEVLEKVVPASKVHPEVTLGLPVRASDKCIEESECLTFEQYMRVFGQIWNRHKTNLTQAMAAAAVDKLQIVLTSESASVIQEKDAFLADASLVKKVPFPFEFITNDYDIQQESGNPQFNVPEFNLDIVLEENNADQIMLSMVSSLQTQLYARYSIGNCCSNFHRLLFELLDGGCGAAYQSGPECLNKNEDPEFRICCLWDNRPECKERKVRETIEKKWAAVKQKRMVERMRRRQEQQQQQEKQQDEQPRSRSRGA